MRSARRIGAGFTQIKLVPKFEEYVEQFLQWSKQQHKPKTHGLHKWNFQTLKCFFSGKYLDEITDEMVEDFKLARKHETKQKAKDGRAVTGATVNRALTTLRYASVRLAWERHPNPRHRL